MADELPALNEFGLLDPGVHAFSLDAIERLFAPPTSPPRIRLFQRLKEYLRELWAAVPEAVVILDGSFVMPKVDGHWGPSDIDIVVLIPSKSSGQAPLNPTEYNLLSHAVLREKYHLDVFVAEAGSIGEQGWIDFFGQVGAKWCGPLSLPIGCQKGLVRVLR